MEETLAGKLFVNSEQVGDYVNVIMPAADGGDGEEIRIHYLEAGVGEPLLLIHGIGQSLYTWRRVFSELSENYRVIAVDLPGHGYSGRPEEFAYSMDEMADLLRGFLDAVDVRSAHMVGFSTGAMYMLRFLTLYPECVANCIAISPGGITKQMPSLIRSLNNPLAAVFTRNLFAASDVKKLLLSCVSDPAVVSDRVVHQYYHPVSDGYSREALMYAVQNFDMDYVTEGLREVDHEVLLLWGKEDRWHTPNHSVFFQGVLQSGRYFLIRGANHLVQEDSPDKLLQVILSYIPPAAPVYRRRRQRSFRPIIRSEAPAPEAHQPLYVEPYPAEQRPYAVPDPAEQQTFTDPVPNPYVEERAYRVSEEAEQQVFSDGAPEADAAPVVIEEEEAP